MSKTFDVTLQSQEDRTEFTVEIEAKSKDEAESQAREIYEYCSVLECWEQGERQRFFEERAARRANDHWGYYDEY